MSCPFSVARRILSAHPASRSLCAAGSFGLPQLCPEPLRARKVLLEAAIRDLQQRLGGAGDGERCWAVREEELLQAELKELKEETRKE